MPPLNLTNTHEDYTKTEEVRIKSRDLFEGSEEVKAKTKTYLFQGVNEGDDQYTNRLKRAALDPFAEKIIKARHSLIFSKEHERTLPATLKKFENDVDNCRTPAEAFFSDLNIDSQVDGIAWVLIDMPKPPIDESGEPIELDNARQEEEAGQRPYFTQIAAADVLDWAVDDDNELIWAVVRGTRFKEDVSQGWGQTRTIKTTWTVWTTAEWIKYEESEEPAKGKKATERYSIVDRGEHNLGTVPLVPILGVKYTKFSGWSVTKKVNDHIILLYNKESDLDHFEELAAHPIPYVISSEKPDLLDAGKGIWIPVGDGGEKVDIGMLEPTGKGFESARLSMADLRFRILSIALSQSKRETAQVESADAQREDRRIFSSSLKTTSRNAEKGEQRCWEIMALWIKEPGTIKITYNRDFDDRMIEAAMLKEFSTLVAEENLTSETFLRILKSVEVLPSWVDVDEEIAKLKAISANSASSVLSTLHAEEQREQGGSSGNDGTEDE